MARSTSKVAPVLHRATAVLLLVAAVAGCTRPGTEPDGSDTVPPAASVGATSTTAASTVPSTSEPPASSTSTAPTSDPAPSTVPATSEPATSTTPAPPTTTPSSTAPATTAPAPTSPDDLVLAADGVLPYRFGGRDAAVVGVLTELLGEPAIDATVEYPTADEGLFIDEETEIGFIAPFGREVCWIDGLCVYFGSGAPESMVFTGWSIGPTLISDDPTSTLTTEDGIGIGTVLADVEDLIDYDPELACFTVAYGFVQGVEVTLQSADGVFSAPNEDGTDLVVGDPDPELVTVDQLAAGERPFFLFADC